MRIELHHRFEGAHADEVERLYLLDDEFNREVFARLGYDRHVVSSQREGERLRRLLRVHARDSLPAPFSSLVPASAFSFDEHTDYDFARREGTWRTVPNVLEKQFRSGGVFSITAEGDAVTFRLEGETTATIPLLGGRAERQAVATALRNHQAIADAVRAKLAAQAALARQRTFLPPTGTPDAPGSAPLAEADRRAVRGAVS
jgi:Protein of unknown function (DUF2505)